MHDRSKAGFVFAVVTLFACGADGPTGPQGLQGLPGPAGAQGLQGSQGDPGAGLVATADAGTQRPLTTVWRDANGTFMPVVHVEHFTANDQDLVELWTQGLGGVVWSLGIEGAFAPVAHLHVAFQSDDCSGPAYVDAIPAMLIFRDDTQAPVRFKYFSPNANVETFIGASGMDADHVCSQSSKFKYSGQRMKLSDAIEISQPQLGFKPPYHASFE